MEKQQQQQLLGAHRDTEAADTCPGSKRMTLGWTHGCRGVLWTRDQFELFNNSKIFPLVRWHMQMARVYLRLQQSDFKAQSAVYPVPVVFENSSMVHIIDYKYIFVDIFRRPISSKSGVSS